jgi:predicted nicotinamide N-methyase
VPQPRSAEDFVRANTTLASPPLVPEVHLHLGWGVVELWEGVEVEAGRTGLEPPFWAFAWPGGQVLARYVLDHPAVVAGRQVLDVASGSGLVAIAAARAGAAEVLARDVDPLAVAAIRVNAAASAAVVRAAADDVLDGDGEGADVVLVGDAFYQRALAERVMGLLHRASARGAVVLLGDPGRAHLPTAALERVATYDVPVLEDLEGSEVRTASVYRLRGDGPCAQG